MSGKTLSSERLRGGTVAMAECADRDVNTHDHTFFEFAYVVSGRAEHTINDRTFILSEGDYFLINRNDTHSYRAIAGEGFRIINCLFLPGFIDRTLAHAERFQEILNDYLLRFGYRKFSDRVTLQTYHDQDGFVGALMRKMLAEDMERRPGYEEILRNCLVSLLICLLRNDTEEADQSDGRNITKFVKEYVAGHYMEQISLSDLSRELNFSLTHVSLTFKQTTRMSFRDYLIKIRVEEACRLLRRTKKSVAEISSLVGYSDPAFFYKVFRKSLGQTPAEYRAREEEEGGK